jgi:hypothetical protein
MKIWKRLIVLILVGIMGLAFGCKNTSSEKEQPQKPTTSSEGHQDGQSGPGAGGYGSPEPHPSD